MRIIHLGCALLGALVAQSSPALVIEYDYSFDTGFLAPGSQARTTFEAAGNFFAARLSDNLTAIDSSGINNFQILFQNPSTGANVQINNVDIAANTIRIYAGARELGGSVLGQAGPGNFSVSGLLDFQMNAFVRGQGSNFNAVDGADAFDFSLWGGAIAFDINSPWSFDLNSGPAAGTHDFLSVALHEFGHVFGIGVADTWVNDVFAATFTGAASVASFGGNVPLSGDLSHWANGTQSTVVAGTESFIGTRAGTTQETSLDPTINIGTRKLITELDLAALDDIGWDVVVPQEPPVEEPVQVPAAPPWFLVTGAALMTVAGTRRFSGSR